MQARGFVYAGASGVLYTLGLSYPHSYPFGGTYAALRCHARLQTSCNWHFKGLARRATASDAIGGESMEREGLEPAGRTSQISNLLMNLDFLSPQSPSDSRFWHSIWHWNPLLVGHP